MRDKYLFSLIMSAVICLPLSAQIMTHIPSETADPLGLAVQITLPQAKRFSIGAPVVVYVPGGFTDNGLPDKGMNLGREGFIEISFSWPGSGISELDQKSGGIYDTRGPDCLKALRDVTLFAMNRKKDKTGKTLSALAGKTPPMTTNVGLVGLSNGGNATISTAGIHADSLSSLAWIVNWESPVGDGMPGAEAGATTKEDVEGQPNNPEVNPAYDDSTGQFDLNTLAYSDTLNINKGHITIPGSTLRGGLYFDINKNGVPDWGKDFVVLPVSVTVLKDTTVYYSERLRKKADDQHLLPASLPKHIPSLQATQDFWNTRNGEKWIQTIVQKNKKLMFLVVAFVTDHVQSAPDHPHVLIQYEGFRSSAARFTRLNPDRVYVERLMGKALPDIPDNDAFRLFDHITIRTCCLPNAPEGISRNIAVAAAACELADRTATDNLNPQLQNVITGIEKNSRAPDAFDLCQNYPNPFNGSTVIPLNLSKGDDVDLSVFDVNGTPVRTLIHGRLAADDHVFVWNGKRSDGKTVPSGLYLCRMKTGSSSQTIKLVFSK